MGQPVCLETEAFEATIATRFGLSGLEISMAPLIVGSSSISLSLNHDCGVTLKWFGLGRPVGHPCSILWHAPKLPLALRVAVSGTLTGSDGNQQGTLVHDQAVPHARRN